MYAAVQDAVFRGTLLQDGAEASDVDVSPVIEVAGNAAVLSVTLINGTGISPSAQLVFDLEASYDRKAWFTHSTGVVTISGNALGETVSSTVAGLDVSCCRVIASLSSTAGTIRALFDATIVFTSQ
ncbi:MAG: hypothetical protein R3C29_17845 [Dehalococcoidia bacterium]